MGQLEKQKIFLKDGSEIILRSPAKEDADQLAQLDRDVFSSSPYLITTASEFETDSNKQRERIRFFGASEGSIIIVAEYQGQVIGNIDFKNRASRRRVAHRGDFCIGIAKNWRDRGVGHSLLLALIEWAKKSSIIEKIEAGVLVANTAAVELYKSVGMEIEGTISGEVKFDDGSYGDSFIMGLWL